MSSPRFITALPVFNEVQYVNEVLDLVKQYSDEILVVDDGSTDGTTEQLQRRDDVRIVTHAENQGYGAALRTAFEYAKKHSFFEKSRGVDYSLLRTIKELTQHLEVSARTGKDWETAILLGFDNWRKLKEFNGGTIHCDLNERTMIYQEINLK